MNNKGFTVVELIVSFVIVMTMAIGLFATVDSYREKEQRELYEKLTISYVNDVLTKIQTDVIDNGGITNITAVDSTKTAAGVCQNKYSQVIKIKLRNLPNERFLCIGNKRSSSTNNGIYYNGFYYEKPTNTIEILDDKIWDASDELEYVTDSMIIKKKIFSIKISLLNIETTDVYHINVTSPQITAKNV